MLQFLDWEAMRSGPEEALIPAVLSSCTLQMKGKMLYIMKHKAFNCVSRKQTS